MSFIDFIERLQNKPKYIRIQILIFCVILSMTAVIFFWLISFEKSVSMTSPEPEESKPETPSLMEVLKASMSAFFEKEETEVKKEKAGTVPASQELSPPLQEKIKPARLPISP